MCISRAPAADPAGTAAVAMGPGLAEKNKMRFMFAPNQIFSGVRTQTEFDGLLISDHDP